MLDPISRLPRVLIAVLTIVSITLFLSYARISSTTYHSLLWPEPELFPADDEDLANIFSDIAPMCYGTSARPSMKAMPDPTVADLPPRYVPDPSGPTRRLVIVGDVHGQRAALERLLDEVRFDRASDHLVLAGDLTNKGPDSAGVVALAMELGAHAVRGNHDDRVLLARGALERDAHNRDQRYQHQHEQQQQASEAAASTVDLETKVFEKGQEGGEGEGEEGEAGYRNGEGEREDPKAAKEEYLAHEAALLLDRDDRAEVQTARSLSPEQVEWLSQLPIILNVGRIPYLSHDDDGNDENDNTDNKNKNQNKNNKPPKTTAPAAFENLVVVHAGLVPNVTLANQDPWAVMTMRTLVYPVDGERRAAVKKYLQDQAEKRNSGKLASMQAIDDDMVGGYTARIMAAQGLGDERDGRKGDEVALPSDGRDGTPWWEEWNRFQERLSLIQQQERQQEEGGGGEGGEKGQAARKKREGGEGKADDDNTEDAEDAAEGEQEQEQKGKERAAERSLKGMTVVYGHDAKSGLKVPDTYGNGKGYTYGLDSGCVYGKKLSALIIEARPEGIVHGITQVGCDKAVDPDY